MGTTLRSNIAGRVLLFALFATSIARGADGPPTIDVWPGRPPGDVTDKPEKSEVGPGPGGTIIRTGNVSKPMLTIYRPAKDKDTGAAVVICPGGGYSILAWDLEGTEVAQWLNSIGVTGVVLKYRVPSHLKQPEGFSSLQDAQRAVSIVRSKSKEWGIDPQRIGMLGFSAGGNLTALACTNYEHRSYEAIDDVDKESCRPDFGVLVYPAWLIDDKTQQLKAEFPVTPQTPRMFFAHADDDKISAANSAVMYLALKQAKVPAELHIYAAGGHGFGLRPSDKPCTTWPQRCGEWMKNQGILKAPSEVK